MNTTRFEAHVQYQEGRLSLEAGTPPASAVSLIGYWSALLTTVFSLAFGLAVIVTLISSLSSSSSSSGLPGWSGIEGFLVAFQPIQMLPVIPSLFLAPAFTALMVSVHYYSPPDKKIWSHLGLSFTLIYATMATINYMVQLIPVWRSIVNKETDGLAMFVLGNPHSFFWALTYAYIFMHLAMLFAAPVFAGGGLEKWIRRLFILNGITVVVTLSGIVVDSPPYYLLGALLVWCPVFTAAAIMLAILFRRNLSARD
jgi:hypothetical protein